MCQRLNFAESAKIALSGGRLADLTTERPRRILILWNWFPSICGGPLGYNLQEGKYTLCPSWMEDHPTNLVLTFLINQTHPLLQLSMLFGLRPSPCLGIRFTGFALIGRMKQWLGKITVAAMEFTAPYSSAQNGLAERAIRTMMDDVHTLLQDSGLSHSYWVESASYSVDTRNLIP